MEHSLQNPTLYGIANDYLQDMSYVVSAVDGKSTYRDGRYTKLAQPVGDPDGLNKRIINNEQADWVPGTFPGAETLVGETDSSAVFSPDYASAQVYGTPFQAEEDQSPIEKA